MNKLKNTENIFVLGLFLATISAIAALALSYVNNLTKEPREQAAKEASSKAMLKILPGYNNNPMDNKFIMKSVVDAKREIVYYGAKKDKKLIGIVAQSSAGGYKGDIILLLSMDVAGEIKTVVVKKHGETPGIGTKVTDRKVKKTVAELFAAAKNDVKSKYNEYGLPYNKFLDQFSKKSINNLATPWKVKKDGGIISEVSGATISSKAVTRAAYGAMKTFEQNREKIISALNK